MSLPIERDRYDVVIAGARCAGASTAMLLARAGLRVLVVDPARRGSDTLSTHALMRGGVLQLHRWGLLDRVHASGAEPIRVTTFHYGDESIPIPIKEKDGVDALYAPRRTVLDDLLVEAALEAGAEVTHGLAVVDLLRDDGGAVRGARIADRDRSVADVRTDLVIGADGIRSKVARLLEAEVDYEAQHASTSIYGYWSGLGLDGYHWYYERGASVGSIPTNDGETCVFASVDRKRFQASRAARGLEELHREALETVSPDLAARAAAGRGPGKLRAFAGEPGFLRRATGPGWALVGDAGYFRDPITAHGITDALREAEFLAQAIQDGDEALSAYQEGRDARVRPLMDVTDRISTFDWSLEEVKEDHLALAKEMTRLVEATHSLDDGRTQHAA